LFTVFGPQKTWQNVGLDFGFEHRKSGKTKKLLAESDEESDRRGDRSSNFTVKNVRISVQLQLQLNSFRT
jgi:hypothetical protein